MKALHKNIIREIQKNRSRFFSIMAIIALSTGFFGGVKSASPTMLNTCSQYISGSDLMDLRLISSVGFDDEDIKSLREMDETSGVLPSYFADLIADVKGVDTTIRVLALPDKNTEKKDDINRITLVDGKMPESEGECLMDSYHFDSLKYSIGDTIAFNEKSGTADTSDSIKHLEYRIVGTVMTPMYITYQRGNTNIGSGNIGFYIYTDPAEFCFERYTCVYLTTNKPEGISCFSDEYDELIMTQKAEYEKLGEERSEVFRSTTYHDAKKELEDGKKTYNEEKEKAEKEIADAEKKISDGEREAEEKFLEAEKNIADAEKKLEDGKTELEKGKKEYEQMVIQGEKALEDGQKQYEEGKAEYEKGKKEFDQKISAAEKELDEARIEFNKQYNEFYRSTKPSAERKLDTLKNSIELYEGLIEKLNNWADQRGIAVDPESSTAKKIKEYEEKLDEYEKQYNEGVAALSAGEKELSDGKAQLDAAQQELDAQKAEYTEKLSEAKKTLDAAAASLKAGKKELEDGKKEGLRKLEEAEKQIADGEKELEKGKKELESGKKTAEAELESAREKLESGRKEAEKKLSDAKDKISEAEEMLRKIEDPKWYVYTRDDNPGFSGIVEDAERVDNVARVFPVFFMLVSLLVCLTSMTRMVEERRTEIGTLKALGYSDSSIALKYFSYAASASIIGSLIGSFIGVLTLPDIIVRTYNIMYILPPPRLVISWVGVILSTLLGLVCTCAVATFACLGELRLNQAVLMRPKAPRPGKRILLEYIRPVWSHMNFTSKVSARNLFRYKARFLMTVLGVAGCTALIIGGCGLKDSISLVADRQFGEITKYDQIFALTKDKDLEDGNTLVSEFREDDRFSTVLLSDIKKCHAFKGEAAYRNDMSIIIPAEKEGFDNIFTLRHRSDHSPVKFDDDSFIITERLAEVLGVKAGDEITFTVGDDSYKAIITDITENYANNYIYMMPSKYETITGRSCSFNVIYTQLTEKGKEEDRQIADKWMKNDDIMTVMLIREQVEQIENSLQSLDVITLVLVVCAGILAMVVLYNLTNINIAERVREIATIKVLGFYDLETANYIYRENIILTLTGAAVGVPLGTVFSRFIVQAIQMDMVMFPLYVSVYSYLLGVILTILFSLAVNFIMYFKMRKISMVESLKSIE